MLNQIISMVFESLPLFGDGEAARRIVDVLIAENLV